MGIYDTENSVQQSFDENSMPEEQLQTQWAEFIELKKAIAALAALRGRPLSILDIGMGEGRVVKHLCGIPEIWNCIAVYDGIDNAAPCLSIANRVISKLNIADKVTARFLEAQQLNSLPAQYDMVITTWFTAGNFYPEDFPFNTYQASGTRLDLSANKRFEKIFSTAYALLHPGGEIILGSCYIDTDSTRIKQEQFYKKLGMTVITDAGDSFTATKEKFWSQRFTQKKLLDYFSFADPANIVITPLDTYAFAMQVKVRK